MIERIELTDFKAHAHTVVDLGRLTVLVGPNSGGKTSVLEALQFVVVGQKGPAAKEPLIESHLAIRRGCKAASITIWVLGEPHTGVVTTDREAPPQPRGFAISLPTNPLIRNGPNSPHDLGRTLLTRLDVSGMRRSSGFSDNGGRNVLNPSGSNLAAQLALMKLTHDEAFQRLKDDLTTLVRTVRNLHATPIGNQFEVTIDFAGAAKVPAQAISEGTLIALALLTFLHEPDPPTLLLIDDIDRGLHPAAQKQLIAILRRLLERRPELQIVATTHSPYIIEAVEPSDVRVCALRKDGTVAVKALLDHPEAERALRMLNAAEFWDAEGEDWVTEETDESKA